MESIKFKKKTTIGDTEHIFVTPFYDIGGNIGYKVDIITLTKYPEIYKYDYLLRSFMGYSTIIQTTLWRESVLREILGAIDILKKG